MSRRAVVTALGIAAVAAGGIVGGVAATSGSNSINLSANASHQHASHHYKGWRMSGRWVFNTINNPGDVTFNQLLGVNNRGQIAGYFGSGAAGHPNKGYLLNLGSRASFFANENVPTAIQTQVIGVNDRGVTVGFWSNQNTASQTNANFGFYTWHGRFFNLNFPTGNNSNPPVNQLLGVNNNDVAVGFYTDAKGNDHGYAYNIRGHWFAPVHVPGASSVTASGINNEGDIVGFYTGRHGSVHGFLRERDGNLVRLSIPGASSTMAFGINDNREVVGTYTVGSGNSAKTFGFVWVPWRHGFATINDPLGSGATTLNGINNAGDLVGFYTDSAGNTDGLLVSRFHAGTSFTPSVNAMPTTQTTMPATNPVTPTGVGPTHF
jgi:hypothetical protein